MRYMECTFVFVQGCTQFKEEYDWDRKNKNELTKLIRKTKLYLIVWISRIVVVLYTIKSSWRLHDSWLMHRISIKSSNMCAKKKKKKNKIGRGIKAS